MSEIRSTEERIAELDDFNRLTYVQSRKTKKLKLWKQIIVEIF